MWNARGTVRHGLKVSMGSSWVQSVSAIQGYAAGVVHAQGGTRPGCYPRRVLRSRGATRAGCYAAGVVPAPRPPDFNVEMSLLYFGVSGASLLACKRGGNTVVGSLKGYTRVGSFKRQHARKLQRQRGRVRSQRVGIWRAQHVGSVRSGQGQH